MICCYQVTKLFCSRYCFASASSARNPRHLGSQTCFTNSIFWVVSKNTVLREYHFCRTFRICAMRNVCGCRNFCIFEIFLWTPPPIPEGLAHDRPSLDCYPSFFCFEFLVESRQFPGARSSLRSVSGLEDVLCESCGGDVADKLVPEFDDNPGTTSGTKFSVLQNVVFPCLVRCGF